MRRILFICSTFALLLGLTACTQDGLPKDGAEGTPMTFTATGLNFPDARSRATVDGNWEGLNTVAVKIGYETKAYTVTSVSGDKASVTLTSENPFYWSSTVPVTVSAWPCTDMSFPDEPFPDIRMPEVIVQADQSGDGFAESDFIAAEPQEVSIGNPSLKFTHRTARLTVTLIAEDGSSVHGATMNFLGLNTSYGNPASIISHNVAGTNVYEALLPPQTINQGVTFISVKLGGISYTYTLKDDDIELEAGNRYNYTMRVNAGKLELVGSTITGWTDILEVEIDVKPSYIVTTNGTYIVYTPEGLYAWANQVNAGNRGTNCILANDIVLPDVAEGESNWTPVKEFSGSFDGNNHSVSRVKINLSGTNQVGFFSTLRGTVNNLLLKDVNIKGNAFVGGISGINYGNIISCSSTGNVFGVGSHVGGVVGLNYYNITIMGCTSTCSVTGYLKVGGVIGLNYGTATSCYFSGLVSGAQEVGGVVGCNDNSSLLTFSYSSGSVSGNYQVGGVVGGNYKTMKSCYSTSSVTCTTSEYGGVVGYNNYGSDIAACYWNNTDKGFGSNNGTIDVKKVDGSGITWETATASMNSALEAENSEWRYVQGEDKTIPPTIQKNQ